MSEKQSVLLRQHIRVVHGNEAEGLTDADVLAYHRDEHRGPGTIRNHDPLDYNSSPGQPLREGEGPRTDDPLFDLVYRLHDEGAIDEDQAGELCMALARAGRARATAGAVDPSDWEADDELAAEPVGAAGAVEGADPSVEPVDSLYAALDATMPALADLDPDWQSRWSTANLLIEELRQRGWVLGRATTSEAPASNVVTRPSVAPEQDDRVTPEAPASPPPLDTSKWTDYERRHHCAACGHSEGNHREDHTACHGTYRSGKCACDGFRLASAAPSEPGEPDGARA